MDANYYNINATTNATDDKNKAFLHSSHTETDTFFSSSHDSEDAGAASPDRGVKFNIDGGKSFGDFDENLMRKPKIKQVIFYRDKAFSKTFNLRQNTF